MSFTPAGGLSSPREKVPGGLVGLTGLDWLTDLIPGQPLAVYARAIAVPPVGDPLADPFLLNINVKLENPILSNSCYIGSDTNPIRLRLTGGTTNPPAPAEPITGRYPDLTNDPNRPAVVDVAKGMLVDNTFSVPKASGCTILLPGLGLVDPLINAQAGLPAAAGTNVARFQYSGALVDPRAGVRRLTDASCGGRPSPAAPAAVDADL